MDIQPGSYLRRLREEPLDIVRRIAGEIGPRRATTVAEAQAAAYLDGRLRLAGLRVSVDAFRAPVEIGVEGPLLALLGLASAGLYYWRPLTALALALTGLAVAAVALRWPGIWMLIRRRTSQNVIATRAAPEGPRWRVVLLAALDSPARSDWLGRALQSGQRALLGRAAACAALALLGMLGMLELPLGLRQVCWYAQWPPAAYLLLLASLDIRALLAPTTPGGVNYAGALATLLASADALNNLNQTELWAVGLGASSSAAGLADLLRRYPFDPEMTLFVGVEGVGDGALSYATREGLLRERRADPLLLQAAADADAEDTLINAEPRHYAGGTTTARALLQAGQRAITIICLDADGWPPRHGRMDDTAEAVDAQVLDRAVRLVAGTVRKIDALDWAGA